MPKRSKEKTESPPKEENANKLPGPFDFLGAINAGKQGPDLLFPCRANSDDAPDAAKLEKSYVPFMVNRGLSFFQDTVLFANEMNFHSHLSNKMQFDFLRLITRPRKRFSKWTKAIDDSSDVQLLKMVYSCSSEKARSMLALYPEAKIAELREKYSPGGTQGRRK